MSAEILPFNQTREELDVSVVMVSYFTGPALFEALSAVTEDPDIREVVLIDNGNDRATREKLSIWLAERETLRVLQGHGNIGFAAGCNFGARLARGRQLLFLNPDAILQPGAARALVAAAQGRRKPTLCGGMLLTVEGKEQRGSRRHELTPWRALVSFTPLHKLPGFQTVHREGEPVPPEPVAMPVVSGALMMMDRESFEMLGGFDEGYFLHVEDIDICRRTRLAGGEVIYVPDAKTLHYGSTSKALIQVVEWEKTKGFIRYFWNYNKAWWARVLTIFAVPGIVAAIMGRAWWLAFRRLFKA